MIDDADAVLPESDARPCILVVEDEMMVAMMLIGTLEDLGCRTLKAARIGPATLLAQSASVDGAIIDVNVAGEPVYAVADELRRRRIPFVFATGYGSGALRPDYRDTPILSKPFRHEDVRRAVQSLSRIAA